MRIAAAAHTGLEWSRLLQQQSYSSHWERTQSPRTLQVREERECQGPHENAGEGHRNKKKMQVLSVGHCPTAWQSKGYSAHWFYIYKTFSEHSKRAHVHIFKNVAAFKIMPWRPSQGPLFKAIENVNNSFVPRWQDTKVSNLRLIGADLTQGRER